MHKNLIIKKKPLKIGVLFLFEPSKTFKHMILLTIIFWLKINQFKLAARFYLSSALDYVVLH